MELLVIVVIAFLILKVISGNKNKRQVHRTSKKKQYATTKNNTALERSDNKRHLIDLYVQLDKRFRSFKITNMTKNEFNEFYSVGVEILKIIPDYMPMVWLDEEQNGLNKSYFHENIPQKLLDYCCRFGEWDKAMNILPFLNNSDVYSKQYSRKLIQDYYARENAILKVARLLQQNAEMEKSEIIKRLQEENKESVQWAMRFFKGFDTKKVASKYFVFLCDIE